MDLLKYFIEGFGNGLHVLQENEDDETLKVTALPGAAFTKLLFSGMVANGDAKLGFQGLVSSNCNR